MEKGGQFTPERGGQFKPETAFLRGGQFTPELGGQFDRNLQVGTHDDYQRTFGNNKDTVEKWLRSQGCIP